MRNTGTKKRIACSFISLAIILSYAFIPYNHSGFISQPSETVASAEPTIDGLKEDLGEVKDAQKEVKNELAKVAQDIVDMQAKVNQTNLEIEQATQDISDTEKSIKRKKKEIQRQETNLNQRLVVMYKNGSVGFMDVLLGSNSISEFISNLEMIQKIYENDVEVLKKLQEEQKKLEEMMEELKEKKAKLAEKKEELAVQQEELNKKKKELEKKEDELKKEADNLTKEIKKMIDAQRRYEGGPFLWPCPSSRYISSTYGNRIHPILRTWKFHTGTDIGASYGADIVAAASGKVIMSQWYGGYGYCVMIDHGDGIVTLYGHCSRLLVSVGQEVSRGAVIAKIGSTGSSTGNHLHFEVRINGEYQDPMKYF